MGTTMIHIEASSTHTIRQSDRSPTSLTPITRVADGERGSKHRGREELMESTCPLPRLVPGCSGDEEWERACLVTDSSSLLYKSPV